MTSSKAVRIHSYGGAEVLRYDDCPKPIPSDFDVLVRVCASGVNPLDWKVRQGFGKDFFQQKLPLTLGWDLSGTVVETGSKATRFKIGDEVFGHPSIARNGSYAEYIAVDENELALKPRSLDHVHAAAIPLAALTAWQAMFDIAGLRQGQSILVHAAAGGVGHFAVQLAKAKGATVIGTASERNHAFLRELGVDRVIDYTAAAFETLVEGMDIVLDTVGGDVEKRSLEVLKPGGCLVSLRGRSSGHETTGCGIRVTQAMVRADPEQLSKIAELVDSKRLRPTVDSTFPLHEARKAHELSELGHTRGKIVLQVA